MPKRVLLLMSFLLVITAIILAYFYWSNRSGVNVGSFSTSTPQTFSNRPITTESPPSCGYWITLQPQVVSSDQIYVGVTVTSSVDIPDLKIRVDTSPALKQMDVPQTTIVLQRNQPFHTTFRLIGTPASTLEEVSVFVGGTVRIFGHCGEGIGFWLDPQHGWQILSDAQYNQHYPPTPRNH